MHYCVADHVLKTLVWNARASTPREICGLVFGFRRETTIYFDASIEVLNGAEDPTTNFEIDGEVFRHAYAMAQRSQHVLAVWHSHPDSKPEPSKEDFALISQLETIPFIIVGVTIPAVTIYEVDELGRVRQAYRNGVTL